MIINQWKIFHEKIVGSPNYKWWALSVVQFGIFFVGVNSTIINLAIPSISKAFSSSISLSQMLIIIYSASLTVFLPITGKLPHFFGRKNVVVGGFLIFTLFSVLSAIAPSLEILIFLQIFLAIGGAALLANSNAITHAVFPGHEHGLAMGINGTICSIGYGCGLILGGYLIEYFGWRSIFWLNCPFGLFAASLAILVLSEKRIIKSILETEKKYRFDYLGSIFFAVGMGSFIFSLKTESLSTFALLIAVFLIALILFAFQERKTHSPLIDINIFRNKVFIIGSISRLLITVIYSSCLFLIPFYTNISLHLTTAEGGMVMAPFALALFFFGPLGGRLSDKTDPVWIMTLGFVFCGIGICILATLNDGSHLRIDLIKTGSAMFFMGSGIGFFVPANNSSTLNAIRHSQVGVASGFLWSMAYTGIAIGTALGGAMFRLKGLEGISKAQAQPNYTVPADVLHSLLTAQKTVFFILLPLSIIGAFICISRLFIKKDTDSQ